MRLKICLSLVLAATLIAFACSKGPSPEELVAPTVESFTIHLMEREDAPGVMHITDFEIVINNPNYYEGEIIYHHFDCHGAGGSVGGVTRADREWSTTLISTNGPTTVKFTGEVGTQGEPDWITDFPKEGLPFKVSGFIRIDFKRVKSFDVPVDGVSGS